MTLLYTDPCFLDHETGSHPECAERLRRVTAHLTATGLASKCAAAPVGPVAERQLTRVHTANYVDQVQQFADQGGGRIEADTMAKPMRLRAPLAKQVASVLEGSTSLALRCWIQG